MELKDLLGEHILTGVDTLQVERDGWRNPDICEAVRFTIDGVHLLAVEDPEDGYRSYMRGLEISLEPPINTFPPCYVTGREVPDGYYENDIIELVDNVTKRVVLRIGTEDVNDYYPVCIFEYSPENMAINNETIN